MMARLLCAALLGLLAWPHAAQAEAMVVAAVLNYAAAYAGTVTYAYAFWATVVVAASYAYSQHQQKSQKAKAERAAADAKQDRLSNLRSAVAPRKLAMGTVRVGGAILFPGSTGPHKTTLTMVMELASHEIDAVEQVFLDGEPVELDADGWVTTWGKWCPRTRNSYNYQFAPGELVPMYSDADPDSIYATWPGVEEDNSVKLTLSPGYTLLMPNPEPGNTSLRIRLWWQRLEARSLARIRWHLGGPRTTGDAALQAAYPGTSHRYAGIAHMIGEFTYDAGVPAAPLLTARIRGAKVLDPRNPSAPAAWSDNPFLCANWLAQHPMAGRLKPKHINQEYLIAAANAADTATNYLVGGQLQARKLYTCGYAHYCDTSTTAEATIDVLVEAAAGRRDWQRGQLCFMAGVYQPVAGTITEDMISAEGESSGGNGSTINDAYNCAEGRHWAESANDEWTDYPRLEPETWALEDEGRHPKTLDLEAVRHTGQAQHVAGVLMRDARQDDTLTLSLGPSGAALKLFYNYKVRLPRFGVADKEYLLLKKRTTFGGGVQVSLKETGAAIFDAATGFPAGDYLPNSNLPKWSEMPDVVITAITSGDNEIDYAQDGTVITRMGVYWAPTGNPRVQAVEVQWAPAQATPTVWAGVTAQESAGKVALEAVVDGVVYLVRARTVGALGYGKWNTQGAHRVSSKEAPPPAPVSFRVVTQANGTRLYEWEYPEPVPRDLQGFDIRYLSQTTAPSDGAVDPQAMVSLATPSALMRSVERSQPGPGEWVFCIQAVDTSGNYSDPLFSDQSIYAPLPAGSIQQSVSLANINFAESLHWIGQHEELNLFVAPTVSGASVVYGGGVSGNGWWRFEAAAGQAFGSVSLFVYQLLTVWPLPATPDPQPYISGAERARLWRVSAAARTDGVLLIEIQRKAPEGGAWSAWKPLGRTQFLAGEWALRFTTTGTWIEDVRFDYTSEAP